MNHEVTPKLPEVPRISPALLFSMSIEEYTRLRDGVAAEEPEPLDRLRSAIQELNETAVSSNERPPIDPIVVGSLQPPRKISGKSPRPSANTQSPPRGPSDSSSHERRRQSRRGRRVLTAVATAALLFTENGRTAGDHYENYFSAQEVDASVSAPAHAKPIPAAEREVKNPFESPTVRKAGELAPYFFRNENGVLTIKRELGKDGETYVWGASTIMDGLSDYSRAFPGRSYQVSPAAMTAALKQYWDDGTHGRKGFACAKGDQHERYLDDAGWAMLSLLDIYTTSVKAGLPADPEALSIVQSMLGVAQENQNHATGLIFWKVQPDDTRITTVSSATTALSALRLNEAYNAAGQTNPNAQANFDFAKQVYDDLRRIMQDPSHVYYDQVALNGSVDKSEFPYNTGLMIQTGLELFKVTGDPQYLQQAEDSVHGALGVFDDHVLSFHDPLLVLPYLKALNEFSKVTTDKALQDATLHTITQYATWINSISDYRTHPAAHNTQDLSDLTLASSQLRALSLAATAVSDQQARAAKGQQQSPNEQTLASGK